VIFAALDYPESYEEIHDDLVAFVKARFASVESGLQSESWIWVHLGNEKVAIDTFTGMKHLIKSTRSGSHVDAVVGALRSAYTVHVYSTPVLEPHEPE
jgi:hypothetical protein